MMTKPFRPIFLAASVAVAQAQPEEQDHTAHPPGAQTAQPTAAPQGQAGGTSMMGGDMGKSWARGEKKESLLVFIGKKLPKDLFIAGLQECLVK